MYRSQRIQIVAKSLMETMPQDRGQEITLKVALRMEGEDKENKRQQEPGVSVQLVNDFKIWSLKKLFKFIPRTCL
jgi:hypothetical protein